MLVSMIRCQMSGITDNPYQKIPSLISGQRLEMELMMQVPVGESKGRVAQRSETGGGESCGLDLVGGLL